jgi:hypothetical protein
MQILMTTETMGRSGSLASVIEGSDPGAVDEDAS